MKAVVVGLGQFGSSAAIAFARAGVETIAIDIDMEPVDAIKDQVDHAVRLDATSTDQLEAQGAAEADFLIAGIGEDFEAQVLLIVQARKLGVKRIVARATSDTHIRVLEAVGAHQVINPEREAAHAIVLRLLAPAARDRVAIGDGLVALEAPTPSGLAGRTLATQRADLLELHGVHLVALRPAAKEQETKPGLVFDEDARIEEGDALLCVGPEDVLARVLSFRDDG